jgi:hypothetical protein
MRPGTRGRSIENQRRTLLPENPIAQAGHFKMCRYRLGNVHKITAAKQL